jgi:hypothetical protein
VQPKLVARALVAWCAIAGAATPAAETTQHITYNHFDQNKSLSYSIDAAPDETIVLQILDTCPDGFTFEVKGIAKAPELPTRAVPPGECVAAAKEMTWKHEKKYGGYLLMITAPAPVSVQKGDTVKQLDSVVLVVHVQDTGWALEVGGGFTVDGLVDPRFALEAHDGAQYVVRTEDTDDAARLGLATFVHAFHHKVPQLALSFGLGLSEASRATYYTGLSLRLSSKAALTGGVAWGKVERLPAGVTSTVPVTDPNILNDLPTRVSAKAFFALSYGFLGTADRLSKPFAGTEPRK